MKTRYASFAAFGLVLVSTAAQAHPGHGIGYGFIGGMTHPFTGLDHMLAMIAIGLWAGQGRDAAARWMPLAALGAMLIGAAIAATGYVVPVLEPLLAASVLIAGLLVLTKLRQPMIASAIAGVFACVHGMAHVAEMVGDSLTGYAAGILLASGLLMAAGFLAGRFVPRARLAGAPIGVAGVWMVVQALA